MLIQRILFFTKLLACGLALVGISQTSRAATDTWNGNSSGTWDTTTSNWVFDGSDTLFNSGNDALFTGTPTNNVTSATGLTIGAITLDSTFTGSVTLTGANTVTGPTTISGGVLAYSADNQLGASAVSLNGGTLRVNTSPATITNSHVMTVGASGGTINLVNTSGATHTFIMGNAGNLTGSGTLTVTASGSLVHGTGATDLVLGNANSGYTGNVILKDGGILEYANSGGVGTGATFSVGNNGELSTFVTLSNAVTLNAGSTLAFQNNNSGVFAGPITLNGDASVRLRDWYGTTLRDGTIRGTITGAHTLTINSGEDNLGTGALLTLNGFDAKASSADIVMNGARLAVNSSTGTAAASVTRGNSLTIKTGDLSVTGVASQNTNDVFGTLNLANGSSGNLQGYSTWTLTPNAATGAALTFTNMGTRTAGSWVALAGTIGSAMPGTAGAGNIFFTNGLSSPNLIGAGGSLGSGTASVIPWLRDQSGTNIYGYDATIGVAPITTVNVNPDSATAGQNIFWNAGATLTADRTLNSMQMAFSGINLGGKTLTVSSGVITADNGSISNGTLDFGTAEAQLSVHQVRTLNISANITGSGGLTFVGFGNNRGSLILGGANTYTGVTNFWGYGSGANSQISLTNSLALQNTTLNNVAGRGYNLNFGSGGTSGQTAYTFGGLTGNQNINLNNNNTTVGAVALTIGSAGSADTAATVNTYSGVLSSTVSGGSVIKDGVATEVFSNANTYDGGTSIVNGKLRLTNTTGSATGTGAVALSGGSTATLSGTGISTGALTVTNGSRIAPGSNVSGANSNFGVAGTLSLGTTGGMTLTSAKFDFDLANTSTVGGGINDLIATGGALSLTSTEAFTFNELSGTLLTGTAYTLISGATSANTGVDTTGWTTSFVNGPSYIPTFGFSGNNLQVTFNVVPEPSTWVMLLGGFGILVGYQRSRRRRA